MLARQLELGAFGMGDPSEPTFEERYGPWICCGCGRPHELGVECQTLETKETNAE